MQTRCFFAMLFLVCFLPAVTWAQEDEQEEQEYVPDEGLTQEQREELLNLHAGLLQLQETYDTRVARWSSAAESFEELVADLLEDDRVFDRERFLRMYLGLIESGYTFLVEATKAQANSLIMACEGVLASYQRFEVTAEMVQGHIEALDVIRQDCDEILGRLERLSSDIRSGLGIPDPDDEEGDGSDEEEDESDEE